MALAISNVGPIFSLAGADLTKLDVGKENERYKYPIYWDATNVPDGRVGDWTPRGESESEADYHARTTNPTKFTVMYSFTHEHRNEGHDQAYVVRATAVATSDATKQYATAEKADTWAYTWTEAPVDFTFSAGIPVGKAPFRRPEFYAVHEGDLPPVNEIITPFYTTYPSADRDYEHRIVYSGDSSFFWDSGQDVAHDSLTVTGGAIEATMFVHDWAPHADYTGYITVSAEGSVVHTTGGGDTGLPEVKKVVAQDGYLIFIEYHTGTAIRIRVLKADEEHVIVNAKNEAIRTHSSDSGHN